MKTMILVNMSVNRCGSSLLMNILRTMGASVGKCSQKPNINNPLGFWENDRVLRFQVDYFSPHWAPYGPKLPPEEIYRLSKFYQPEYDRMIDRQYGITHFAAVKCMMACLVPFALQNKNWVPKIIWARRDPEGQTKSINRYYNKRSNVDPQILSEVTKSNKWTTDFFTSKKIPHIEIWFNDVLKDPYGQVEKISKYTGLPMLKPVQINQIIHPEFSRSSTL